jgi:hypothetical protein
VGLYPTPLEQRLSSLVNKLDRRVSLLEVAGGNPAVIGGVLAQQAVQSPDYDPVAATGWGLTSASGGLLQNVTIIHQPTPGNQLVGDDATMTSSIGGWTAVINCSVGYGLAPDNATECLEMTIGAQSGAPAIMENPTFFAISVAAGDIVTVSARWWATASGLTVQHAIMFADDFGGPITGGQAGLLGGTYAINNGSFTDITDTVTVPEGATQLLGLQATVNNGATNQLLYNAGWTVQDASNTSPGGLFVYNGPPGIGTPPVFAAVAPNVTVDAYGNPLINEVGQIPNAIVIVGANTGPQIFLEPNAGIVFGAGILETVLRLSSAEANELMDGLIGAMIANQGAANQQMAIVLAAPAPSNALGNSCALVLTANSDDNTIAAALTYGVITTDGQSETFNPVAILNDNGIWQAQTYIAYAEGVQPVIVVYNSAGTHNFIPPAGVSVCKAEGWASGGGGGGTDSTGQQWAGGGGGGAGYSCEPALVITPLVTVPVTIGAAGTAAAPGSAGGTGGNTTITGTSVTVIAHGGGGGQHGTSGGGGANGVGGPGGTVSANTISFAGGVGGAGTNTGQGYNCSGGGGSAAGTGIAGQVGAIFGTVGAVGAGGGGSGGDGTVPTMPYQNPTAGGTPGGGGGGQVIAGRSAAHGGVGLVRITYLPPGNVPVASISGVGTVDSGGQPIPTGLYGQVTLPLAAAPPATPVLGPVMYSSLVGTPSTITPTGFIGVPILSQTDFSTVTNTAQTSFVATSKVWSIPARDAQSGTFYRLTVAGAGTIGTTAEALSFQVFAWGVSFCEFSIGASEWLVNEVFEFMLIFLLVCQSPTSVKGSVMGTVGASTANQLTVAATINQSGGFGQWQGATVVNTTSASSITMQTKWNGAFGVIASGMSVLERGGA